MKPTKKKKAAIMKALTPKKDEKPSQPRGPRKTFDQWANPATGLGIRGKDRRVTALPTYQQMSQQECEVIYGSDGIAARIVDLLPDEATKEWFEIHIDEKFEVAVLDALDELGTREQFHEAFVLSRIYGGSGIYVALEDGLKPEEPVDLNKIKKVLGLTVLSRYELQIQATDLKTDIASPKFGKPIFYTLQVTMGPRPTFQKVHCSRVLRFDCIKLPRHLHTQNGYWGASIFSRCKDQIRDFDVAHGNVANIIQDARLAVLQFEGLQKQLAGDNADEKTKASHLDRLAQANLTRSNFGYLVLDKNDSFAFPPNGACQGISELIDQVKFRLQTVVDIPHTVLFGESPSGTLGPTGNSEQNSWFSFVRSKQDAQLSPNLKALFTYLFASKQGPTKGQEPKAWTFNWKPLYQESTLDKLLVREKQAAIDGSYIDHGVLDPMEVKKSRFGGENYSIETTVNTEDDDLFSENEGDDEEIKKPLVQSREDKG